MTISGKQPIWGSIGQKKLCCRLDYISMHMNPRNFVAVISKTYSSYINIDALVLRIFRS